MQPTHPTLAAAHGMDFSRPFHDRRVVELGLAIPESLEFRHGLERHLARHAFADILPPRLLARGPGNDAEEPDMFRMAKSEAPAALAEARRLDRDGRLSRYVDFDRIERTLVEAEGGEAARSRCAVYRSADDHARTVHGLVRQFEPLNIMAGAAVPRRWKIRSRRDRKRSCCHPADCS